METQSTTLNLWLINQFEKEDFERRMDNRGKHIYKPERFVTIDNAIPVLPKTQPWANTSINHNLKQFLQHNDLPESHNPLNDHSLFEGFPVLAEGWVMPTSNYKVNQRRHMPRGNGVHSGKFQCIFSAVNFDKNNPICLDRNGHILDGAIRMSAYANLNAKETWGGSKVYVRQYDFE